MFWLPNRNRFVQFDRITELQNYFIFSKLEP
ncbi:hypothetical protein BRLA_c004120 [Brevibacillus laterosporus LMG 15441]|uniref:Uncharacterized protein n=1 Tax=Brevibacillus laterosporus LMG 15441 TaxID=1042163 RepID=A0A075R0V5_BRELA|nr:hypothetical protein BRLA_c004120 [Brevibacillus laterosporus LMG 15441]